MTLGISLITTPSAQADPGDGVVDFAAAATHADLAGGAAPPADNWFALADTTAPVEIAPMRIAPAMSSAPALTMNSPALPALRAEGSAIAPLPPALLLAPIGITMVAYATYRLRKKARI
jgi:hypothetical protein